MLIATPTTLIALLRAVAYGWQQERVAEDARAVAELGRTLHRRLEIFAEHLQQVGSAAAAAPSAPTTTPSARSSTACCRARGSWASTASCQPSASWSARSIDVTTRALAVATAESGDERAPIS